VVVVVAVVVVVLLLAVVVVAMVFWSKSPRVFFPFSIRGRGSFSGCDGRGTARERERALLS